MKRWVPLVMRLREVVMRCAFSRDEGGWRVSGRTGARWRAGVLGIAAALSLGGCSLPLADLPSPMGLPVDAPARPATPPDYPTVNDQVPNRQDTTLSDDERKRLEKELELARERQKGVSRQN